MDFGETFSSIGEALICDIWVQDLAHLRLAFLFLSPTEQRWGDVAEGRSFGEIPLSPFQDSNVERIKHVNEGTDLSPNHMESSSSTPKLLNYL